LAGGTLETTFQYLQSSANDSCNQWKLKTTSTGPGGGKHLVTDYEYDTFDRLIQTLGPQHEVDLDGTATTVRTASWTVYKSDTETWTGQGYATGTGRLNEPSGSQPRGRRSYVAAWQDAVGRPVATADYGTNNGSSLTRPSTVPARSDTVLVTSAEYDSTGRAYKSIDPAAKETRTEFDQAGRPTKVIRNYVDGSVSSSYPDEDVTVETAYTSDGALSTLTAKNPTTGDQVTKYVYGTTLTDSSIARADLLRAVIYPDSDDTSSAGGLFTKGLRATSVRYPNGRLVHYDYGSSGSTADAIHRIDSIKDNSGGSPGATLAAYSYLGQGGIVQVDYQEPDVRYDLAFGTGSDPNDGLDRFDRVIDLLWRNYGTSTDAVRIKHGYDRAGNRLWREDPVAASYSKNFDELYTYDGVNQLKTLQRGDLNANHDAVTSKNFAEDWTLDMTGNWPT